jgi:hypothetical protein
MRSSLLMRKSILVICQELFEKVLDMFLIKKGALNRHTDECECMFGFMYLIRRPIFRRCTVGF